MKHLFLIVVFLGMSLAALNLMLGSRMPWHAWLDANFPAWAAVINIICFSIISIILFTDFKKKFTANQSKALLLLFLIPAFLLNVSIDKALIVFVISIAIVLLIRLKLAIKGRPKEKRKESD